MLADLVKRSQPLASEAKLLVLGGGYSGRCLASLARAMAIRAWMDGDLRLAVRLLQWAQPDHPINEPDDISIAAQAA